MSVHTMSGVVPVYGGPVAGMGQAGWDDAVQASAVSRDVEERLAAAVEDNWAVLRNAQHLMRRGVITAADYEGVREQTRATARRALQVGAVIDRAAA